MLTLEYIRENCIPGETVFVGHSDVRRLFIATYDDAVIVKNLKGGAIIGWGKNDYEHWTIEKPKKKPIEMLTTTNCLVSGSKYVPSNFELMKKINELVDRFNEEFS